MTVEEGSHPRLNNVFGYVKYGKFVWGAASTLKSTADDATARPQEYLERSAAQAA